MPVPGSRRPVSESTTGSAVFHGFNLVGNVRSNTASRVLSLSGRVLSKVLEHRRLTDLSDVSDALFFGSDVAGVVIVIGSKIIVTGSFIFVTCL